jgi:hypothetical protein
MKSMKVVVCMCKTIEVEDSSSAMSDLLKIHQNGGVGNPIQYEMAIETVEQATGYKFYDSVVDKPNHEDWRITAVVDENFEDVILEG